MSARKDLKWTPRAREMQRLEAERQRSGAGVAEFAYDQGIRLATFRWWQRRLRRLERADGGDSGFVEVKPPEVVRPPERADYEFQLPAGATLRIPGGFVAEEVETLLAIAMRQATRSC
jgi:hypothetical protein